MAGVHYWHGVFHTRQEMPDTPYYYDSISTIFDTFEIKIINNSTINVKGDNLSVTNINDNFYIKYNYDYHDPYSPYSAYIYYYYNGDSIKYTFSQGNSYQPYYYELHTP